MQSRQSLVEDGISESPNKILLPDEFFDALRESLVRIGNLLGSTLAGATSSTFCDVIFVPDSYAVGITGSRVTPTIEAGIVISIPIGRLAVLSALSTMIAQHYSIDLGEVCYSHDQNKQNGARVLEAHRRFVSMARMNRHVTPFYDDLMDVLKENIAQTPLEWGVTRQMFCEHMMTRAIQNYTALKNGAPAMPPFGLDEARKCLSLIMATIREAARIGIEGVSFTNTLDVAIWQRVPADERFSVLECLLNRGNEKSLPGRPSRQVASRIPFFASLFTTLHEHCHSSDGHFMVQSEPLVRKNLARNETQFALELLADSNALTTMMMAFVESEEEIGSTEEAELNFRAIFAAIAFTLGLINIGEQAGSGAVGAIEFNGHPAAEIRLAILLHVFNNYRPGKINQYCSEFLNSLVACAESAKWNNIPALGCVLLLAANFSDVKKSNDLLNDWLLLIDQARQLLVVDKVIDTTNHRDGEMLSESTQRKVTQNMTNTHEQFLRRLLSDQAIDIDPHRINIETAHWLAKVTDKFKSPWSSMIEGAQELNSIECRTGALFCRIGLRRWPERGK